MLTNICLEPEVYYATSLLFPPSTLTEMCWKATNYSTRSLGPLLWEYGNKCMNGLQRQIHYLWNLLQLGGEGWGMGVPPGRMSDPGLSWETAMCHALPHISSLPHRPWVLKHPSLRPTSLWLDSVLAKGPKGWYHCWHFFHWKEAKNISSCLHSLSLSLVGLVFLSSPLLYWTVDRTCHHPLHL